MCSQLPVKLMFFLWKQQWLKMSCSENGTFPTLRKFTATPLKKDVLSINHLNNIQYIRSLMSACESLAVKCSLKHVLIKCDLSQSKTQWWVCCVVMRAGCGLRMRRRKIRTPSLTQRTEDSFSTTGHTTLQEEEKNVGAIMTESSVYVFIMLSQKMKCQDNYPKSDLK